MGSDTLTCEAGSAVNRWMILSCSLYSKSLDLMASGDRTRGWRRGGALPWYAWSQTSGKETGRKSPLGCHSEGAHPEILSKMKKRVPWSFVRPCRCGWNCWRKAFAHDQARERQEHLDMQSWAAAARLRGIAPYSASTESEIAVSSGAAGSSWPGDTSNAAAAAAVEPVGEARPSLGSAAQYHDRIRSRRVFWCSGVFLARSRRH